MFAISHATTILAWQENLLEDEMPPEWMWSLDEDLAEWFKDVAERRRERFGGTGSPEKLEDAPDMMVNELTRGRFGR